MNKYLVILGVLILGSCGSSKKISSNKKRAVITADAIKEVEIAKETVKNIGEVDKVDKVVEKTNKVIKTKPNNVTLNYVEQFAPLAMDEMRKFKIPASITLAQGILESGSGRSNLANKSNNHFGIKCHKGWKGERVYHDDDAKGECFRKYKYPATSYQDHSLFLTTRFRYASLFALENDDYKSWAKGLKKAGYATDPKYPNKLISYIEKYELYKYDELVLKGLEINKVTVVEELNDDYGLEKAISKSENKIKEIKSDHIHIVQSDDTLYSISKEYGITIEELITVNDLLDNNIHEGEVLKLPTENKPIVKYHNVQTKETLYSISKKYGLTVDRLKGINNLKTNILSIGQQLKIR